MHQPKSQVNMLLIIVAIMAVAGGLTIVIVTSPQSWAMGPAAWFQPPLTITPLPTSTDTPTPTSIPPTETPTPQPTDNPDLALPTATLAPPTADATATATQAPPTPTLAADVRALAIVTVSAGVNTGRVRNAPNGDVVIAAIPAGTQVEVLFGEVMVDGIEWLQVRMENGRVGWMAAFLLTIIQEQPQP